MKTTQSRLTRGLAWLSVALVLIGISSSASAADNAASVFLHSVDTPEVGIGGVLTIKICVPTPLIREVRKWQLSLGGIPIKKEPVAFAVIARCDPVSGTIIEKPEGASQETGSVVKLKYFLDYDSNRRIDWVQIFNQRDQGTYTVDIGLLAADATPFSIVSTSTETGDVRPEVALRKYPSVWWIPGLIVVGLLASLYAASNSLRDGTLSARRYFAAQMEGFNQSRKSEVLLRRGLLAKLMTKNISNAGERIAAVLNEADPKKREALAQALAFEMDQAGIADADTSLADVYTACAQNKRWSRRLRDEMKQILAKDKASLVVNVPDPYEDVDGFESLIISQAVRNRLPPFSLGRLQMAWWFLIIIAGVSLMYVSTGTLFQIPDSVLVLIGISVATGGIGYAIDNRKPPTALPPASNGLLRDMASDTLGDDTFYRWQMLVVTILLGLVFIIELVRNFVMTDFDMTMLGLMGISSGTYLGFKWPERSAPTLPQG